MYGRITYFPNRSKAPGPGNVLQHYRYTCMREGGVYLPLWEVGCSELGEYTEGG